ncbi:hypothetical protein [uncultured Tateyamaria sp.]|nr:hypothetical protein [uncultured Tateyamaria sp.]
MGQLLESIVFNRRIHENDILWRVVDVPVFAGVIKVFRNGFTAGA